MILDFLNEINCEDYTREKSSLKPSNLHPHSVHNDRGVKSILAAIFGPNFSLKQTDRPSYSHVDWITATTSSHKDFNGFMSKFLPLFKGHDLEFLYREEKGLNGYKKSWDITFNDELYGNIAADEKMGGMFQLTGKGCQLMQVRWDLWNCLVAGFAEFGMGLTRLDVATDMKGKIWDEYNVNMLDINKLVDGGLHKNNMGKAPSVSLIGDWSSIVANGTGSSDYDPMVDAPSGLTVNVGSRQSVNTYCWYEKGKQLMGIRPDAYDGGMNSWIRCERRFGRGSGRSRIVIPLDFAVSPDDALVYNSPGLKDFVDDWLLFQSLHGVSVDPVSDISVIDIDRVGLMNSVSLKSTALHVASQCARFFKTLDVLGVDPAVFIDKVKSDKTIKGFSLGLVPDFDLDEVLGAKYA